MEPKIQSSFIPKKPITAQGSSRRARGRSWGLVFTLALIIFLGALGVAAELFIYKQFLQNSIERKSEALEQARALFAPAQIEELRRLDARIRSAEGLLARHLAPSLLFDFLEESTLKTVQFKDLEYAVGPEGDIQLVMNGTARNFASVALQSDVFGGTSFLKGPIFSDLNLDPFGNAIFVFETVVNPGALSYEMTVEVAPEVEEEENAEGESELPEEEENTSAESAATSSNESLP